MRRLASLCLLAGLGASGAQAQRALQEPDGEGVIMPKMSYPAGHPEAIARLTWNALRSAARQDRCREVGCLILVNDSASYRLQEFYIRPFAPRSESDWGPNQLDQSLMPKEAAIRFKLPDERFCSWPVRFVFRHRRTREVVPIESRANLCASPTHDTVLKIRIVKPDVHVGG